MKANILLSLSLLSMMLLPVSSCKKSTACGTEIVCASVGGTLFAGNTYTPGYTQYWQVGSYARLTVATGQLSIIGGNVSLQSWLILNVLANKAYADTTYSPAKGNLTCIYGIPDNVTPQNIPNYLWEDSTSSGTLVLSKLDTVNNLVSGTFTGLTMDAEYGQSPTTYTVTGGTFTDIPLIRM